MGRYGNIDYPTVTKRAFLLGVSLFLIGVIGEVVGQTFFRAAAGVGTDAPGQCRRRRRPRRARRTDPVRYCVAADGVRLPPSGARGQLMANGERSEP